MSTISVQVSLYPLRQPHLGPTISKVLEVFRARGLEVRPGTMSTVVVGDTDAVFDGLKASFQSAAALGDVVMMASISNCCPASAADSGSFRNVRS
jgi:uncharacterized protein YqgV (UPF0045/DUF77 family)